MVIKSTLLVMLMLQLSSCTVLKSYRTSSHLVDYIAPLGTCYVSSILLLNETEFVTCRYTLSHDGEYVSSFKVIDTGTYQINRDTFHVSIPLEHHGPLDYQFLVDENDDSYLKEFPGKLFDQEGQVIGEVSISKPLPELNRKTNRIIRKLLRNGKTSNW